MASSDGQTELVRQRKRCFSVHLVRPAAVKPSVHVHIIKGYYVFQDVLTALHCSGEYVRVGTERVDCDRPH